MLAVWNSCYANNVRDETNELNTDDGKNKGKKKEEKKRKKEEKRKRKN